MNKISVIARVRTILFLPTFSSIVVGVSGISCQGFPGDDETMLTLPSYLPTNHYRRIKMLSVTDGATLDVFQTLLKFPRLRDVDLTSESNNVKYLHDLSRNYPLITSLTIVQKAPLTDEELSDIRKFARVTLLTLNAPIEHPNELSTSLPPHIRTLIIGDNSNLTVSGAALSLASIETFEIIGVSISAAFFELLQAPKLTHLRLTNSILDPGAGEKIVSVKSLKKLSVYKTILPNQDLKIFKKNGIHVYGNPREQPVEKVLQKNTPMPDPLGH